MATGDILDITARIRRYLPSWFPDATLAPVANALAVGAATALAQVYALLADVRLQTRITTSTDGWLDLASLDFFGLTMPRRVGEADAPFRTRLLAALFPERATRPGMLKSLTLLTGTAPTIVEPWRPADVACFGQAYLGNALMGSTQMPAQAFIAVSLPLGSGGAGIAGLGSNYAGIGGGYMAAANQSSLSGTVTAQDVYDTVNAFKAEGTTMWVQITG